MKQMSSQPMSSFKHKLLKFQGAMMHAMPGMITCAQFDGFICDYLDQRLPKNQARTFERHMQLCKDCRQYLEAYSSTIELERAVLAIPDAAPPADAPEELITAILAARQAK